MNPSALNIRNRLDLNGYAVADVGDRENYLAICNQLGKVTQTREIFLKPREQVEKYTGYSHLPDEVPFHTDHPLVNVVGLFCEEADNLGGGENLLIDTRDILEELSPLEVEVLKSVQIPLPRSEDRLPLLIIEESQPPHVYWLPAFAIANLDKLENSQAVAVRRFNQVISIRRREKRHLFFKLKSGQAIWFDNFVMLHGRDQLDPLSKRLQVRAFIQYVRIPERERR
ncbi:MAG: hypothetical protein A2846_04665 [Candidatus Doudnabacteria bacterium RIFCSPHIGHO2_01_FULL_49_9]|uniref:TauD/TfdA-like domain-containing protein n=1 Tax=Candidatus Doudnabacteria bacterium RIFCSPHIGHO2_01_FULL_49_9 TaxID=1817827 RepID=A0A1F5P3Q9_9BACT|nr:MAG: hypothetical protein A2846_04665 [Candidatus Doudnabacteria bacterium RIFCSPHIGHO2_01_FULL_49_9]